MKNSFIAIALSFILLYSCNTPDDTIRIATKPMTEQFILGEMLRLLIEENSDLQVKITKGIGGGTSNIHPGYRKRRFRPLSGIHGYRMARYPEKRLVASRGRIVFGPAKRVSR